MDCPAVDDPEIWSAKENAKSMLRIIGEQFLQHRAATWSAVVLAVLLLIATGAPALNMLLGVDSERQNVLNRYRPFGNVSQLTGSERERVFAKFVSDNPEMAREVISEVSSLSPGILRTDVGLAEQIFQLSEAASQRSELLQKIEESKSPGTQAFVAIRRSFSLRHYLGTDELGRDVLARLIYGARVTLAVGILASLSAGAVGLLVGSVAGFFGGWIDMLLMRFTDMLLALPSFPLQILLAAVDLKKLPVFRYFLTGESESIIKILIILVGLGWMASARLVRGQVLSMKQNEFVLAARTVGASNGRIILLHITPNVLGPLLVQVTLGAAGAMMAETGLSFLGLGIQPPTPSWGNMLNNAMELVNSSPFLAFAPGFMIFLVTICVNFVGDGLRDALDPKAIRR